MSKEKNISEVFTEAEIPETLSGSAVCALKIDMEKRSMDFILKLCSDLPYKEIEKLKSTITKAYLLNGITVRALFQNMPPKSVNNIGRDYILGELCDKNPIHKYIFEGSDWDYSEGMLFIKIKHGCGELLKKYKALDEISKILKRWGIDAEISLSEELGEVEFAPVEFTAPPKKTEEKKPENGEIYLGKPISGGKIDISGIRDDSGRVIIEGEVFYIDARDIKNEKKLITFYVKDKTGAVICKFFTKNEVFENIIGEFK